MELPSLNDYLESRIRRTDILDTIKRGSLKHRKGINYSVVSNSLWPDKDKLRSDVLSKNKIEKDIELRIIDLPKVHDLV